ncbi:MAG: DUF2892 domain-containing protein [Gammaproteobacteria bacterium]|nr:DUF2892 domain-containing protein [Gammaproteobacteria bacterium]
MNVGKLDRLIRVFIGLIFIGLAYSDTIGMWGYIVGAIPLATGLLRWCPLYTVAGVQTCPLHEAVKYDK